MRIWRTAAAGLALVIAACGGSSGSEGVATLSGEGDGGTDAAPAEEDVDPEEAMLEFAQCMREEGIDFPDPTADGGIIIGPDNGIDPGDPDFREAEAACEDHLPELTDVSEEDRAEMEDRMRAMAACMREHGFDVPDPEISEGPGGGARAEQRVGGEGEEPDFDPEDPEFRAAQRECADEVGFEGPGMGGRTRSEG